MSKPISLMKFIEAVAGLLSSAETRRDAPAPETQEAAAPDGEAASETVDPGREPG